MTSGSEIIIVTQTWPSAVSSFWSLRTHDYMWKDTAHHPVFSAPAACGRSPALWVKLPWPQLPSSPVAESRPACSPGVSWTIGKQSQFSLFWLGLWLNSNQSDQTVTESNKLLEQTFSHWQEVVVMLVTFLVLRSPNILIQSEAC